MRFVGEARKGQTLTLALGLWGCGLWGWRARGGGAWPPPMEHEAQPHQGDQYQLIEKEVGDHGKIPSYRWRNEGIVPGFAGYRISRKLEVQDRRPVGADDGECDMVPDAGGGLRRQQVAAGGLE